MARVTKEIIGIKDAMDNLASIMSINMDAPPPIGVVKKTRIVTDADEIPKETVQWLSGEGSDVLLSVLDLTYSAIHHHLQNLYQNAQMNWSNEKTKKGVAAMMSLVGESAAKMDSYLSYRLDKKDLAKVSDRESFKGLQKFYSTQFALKFDGGIEGEEAWAEEWEQNEDGPLLDLSKRGLSDFNAVRRDAEYELFYIRNEEGKPYFNEELLRNIKLSCDFDLESESMEEDPLLKIRAMEDRNLQSTAKQILGECYPVVCDFYKIAQKLEENELAKSLSMAALALFMAANSTHLIQNTSGKSCQQYFSDFHRFLRRCMHTSEYQKLVAYPPDKSDRVAHLLLYLTHSLARAFFHRVGGIRQEAIGLIHRTMRRGEEIKQKEKEPLAKGETVWNQFIMDDDKFRSLLAQFPNGPLFKTLDVIREAEEEDVIVPFDPIAQGNLPSKLFEVEARGQKIEVLRIPSPTRQSTINKVEIADEFRGFLRSLAQDRPARKHLMVNLQDRTSWKEYARARALETLQMNAEFGHQYIALTLPKDTEFYYQSNEYINMNQADSFMEAFKAQLETPEECGFFFPSTLRQEEISRFVSQAFPAIHQLFFHGKNAFTRRNREDFIEIFYQLLILKCIDLSDPHSISFTCKDAIDTGAAQDGTFYGFLKLLKGDLSERGDQDFLRWLLYSPALFVRERAIDPERLNRTLSALERIDGEMRANRAEVVKQLGDLYSPQLFKSLTINHL